MTTPKRPTLTSVLSVSRETIRQIALTLDQYELHKGRWGARSADRHRKPRGAGPLVTRPLERVEIDHFHADVHLVCSKTKQRLGRPWITTALDVYSKAILGYHVTFAPPSAESVLAALRHAILPKSSSVSTEHGLEPPPELMGIPDTVVVDNGLDLHSKSVREALLQLGVRIVATPPRQPWFKGTIERIGGRSPNLRFIHWLPGTTYGKQMHDFEYNGASNAAMTLDEFERLFDLFAFHIHFKTPPRRGGPSPSQKWRSGIELWPVRLPLTKEEFDAKVALTENRVLTKAGVSFEYLTYQSEELGRLWNRCREGTRVTLKIDPLDIRAIRVVSPVDKSVLVVRCTTHFEGALALSYHVAVNKLARRIDLDPTDERDREKAERLMRETVEAAHRRKKVLRPRQADHASGRKGTGRAAGRASETSPALGESVLDEALGKVVGKNSGKGKKL